MFFEKIMKKTFYEWWLRAYTYDPNSDDNPYYFIDDWDIIDADEDKISFIELKQLTEKFYNCYDGIENEHKKLPISHYEIELVQLKVDEFDNVEHSFCWVNKNGNLSYCNATGFKPPKRFLDQIKKWKHLDFYKNQYIET